jgi:phytoene/squalene synthetase
MNSNLASNITKAASHQTYYTIRFLVEPSRREDAYRAYAYFRWVDFVDRQKRLLDRCLLGETPPGTNRHEAMLAELVKRAGPAATGLHTYLRQMMQVMAFDVERRGRLISQAELNEYTSWLATAVTEATSHFFGDAGPARREDGRYLAASAAHVLHMLRDTYEDVRAGYFNIPREILVAGSIGPGDVDSEPYRSWVRSRVQLARTYLDAGRPVVARLRNPRHRLAGLAYIARFDWLIETLERDDFLLRAEYPQGRSLARRLLASWRIIGQMGGTGRDLPRPRAASHRGGHA